MTAVSATQLTQMPFGAHNFQPAHVTPQLQSVDLHAPLYNAILALGASDSVTIFTQNLLSRNNYCNDEYSKLLTYYVDILIALGNRGGTVDLKMVASECAVRYAAEQIAKQPALSSYLTPQAVDFYNQKAIGIKQAHDQILNNNQVVLTPQQSGMVQVHQPTATHGGGMYQTVNQGNMHAYAPHGNMQQQNTQLNNTIHHNTPMQGGNVMATPANPRSRGRKRNQANVPQETVVQNAPLNQRSLARPTRKRPSLVRNTSDVSEPVVETLSVAPSDDWYDDASSVTIDAPTATASQQVVDGTGQHQSIESTTAQTADIAWTRDTFPKEFAFYNKLTKEHEVLPGVIVADGSILYPAELIVTLNPRRYFTEINGFYAMARFTDNKHRLEVVYIEETLMDYDAHELTPRKKPITQQDMLTVTVAKQREVKPVTLKLYKLTGGGENNVDYDLDLARTIANRATAPDEERKVIIHETSNCESLAVVDIDDEITDPLNYEELRRMYAKISDVGKLDRPVAALDKAKEYMHNSVRSLVDDHLCINEKLVGWDDIFEDSDAILSILKEEMASDTNVSDLFNTLAKNATSTYRHTNESPYIGHTLDGEEIEVECTTHASLVYLTTQLTGWLDINCVEAGIDGVDESVNALQLSARKHKLLFTVAENAFGTGYAYTDDKPNELLLELNDGAKVMVYRQIEGRNLTYRVVN